MEFENQCNAWPLDIVMPEDEEEASSDVVFIVKIEATHTYVPQSMVEEDDSLQLFDNLETETFRKTFRVKRDAILHETTSGSTISNMLFEVGVPMGIQDFMLHRIMACARDMATHKRYAGRKVLRMCVSVDVTQCVDDNFVLGLPADDDDPVCGLAPASKSSIEALEKVEIVEGNRDTCSICLDELVIGPAAAARMPCSHQFHQNCIVYWLQRNNFCPLCRFKLPARE
ncbi:hypothetical protein SLA2020_407420 [Shorea laevis]